MGEVTLQATIPLDGLVGDAYMLDVRSETQSDVTLDFTGADTIEWTSEFSVINGDRISLATSSANVPDLDLYLYFWNGASWVQVSSSAGATATESIDYINPADGAT